MSSSHSALAVVVGRPTTGQKKYTLNLDLQPISEFNRNSNAGLRIKDDKKISGHF